MFNYLKKHNMRNSLKTLLCLTAICVFSNNAAAKICFLPDGNCGKTKININSGENGCIYKDKDAAETGMSKCEVAFQRNSCWWRRCNSDNKTIFDKLADCQKKIEDATSQECQACGSCYKLVPISIPQNACPDGYSTKYQSPDDCGDNESFSENGTYNGKVCGACTKTETCPSGYSTQYQSKSDCESYETFSSKGNVNGKVCGKCTRTETCPSGYSTQYQSKSDCESYETFSSKGNVNGKVCGKCTRDYDYIIYVDDKENKNGDEVTISRYVYSTDEDAEVNSTSYARVISEQCKLNENCSNSATSLTFSNGSVYKYDSSKKWLDWGHSSVIVNGTFERTTYNHSNDKSSSDNIPCKESIITDAAGYRYKVICGAYTDGSCEDVGYQTNKCSENEKQIGYAKVGQNECYRCQRIDKPTITIYLGTYSSDEENNNDGTETIYTTSVEFSNYGIYSYGTKSDEIRNKIRDVKLKIYANQDDWKIYPMIVKSGDKIIFEKEKQECKKSDENNEYCDWSTTLFSGYSDVSIIINDKEFPISFPNSDGSNGTTELDDYIIKFADHYEEKEIYIFCDIRSKGTYSPRPYYLYVEALSEGNPVEVKNDITISYHFNLECRYESINEDGWSEFTDKYYHSYGYATILKGKTSGVSEDFYTTDPNVSNAQCYLTDDNSIDLAIDELSQVIDTRNKIRYIYKTDVSCSSEIRWNL